MRVRRKSIGGMSATSADVHTATTPGSASAACASIETMRPCAWPERTTRMCSMRGKAMSAANTPRPVTSGRSSRRSPKSERAAAAALVMPVHRPSKSVHRSSGIAFRALERSPVRCCFARTGGAQRGADALRRRRELVDRDAERRQRIVDGVDDRRRRADGAALAQPLGLGDRRLRQRSRDDGSRSAGSRAPSAADSPPGSP